MPRGGGGRGPKKNYKGKSRHFTDAETLKEQLDKEKREKEWRKARGDEDDEPEGAEGAEGAKAKDAEDSSSEESESSEDEDDKHKGVSHLIDIQNPNHAVKKTKGLSAADSLPATGSQLSRREREEVEKAQAKERYNKLHMEGKTDEARTDMARLALIRKQREDAAKQREQEKQLKEAASKKS